MNQRYIVTDKSNPEAIPFNGQHWLVKASSPEEAIARVIKQFAEGFREKAWDELTAYPEEEGQIRSGCCPA
jgi:hypothetical protein